MHTRGISGTRYRASPTVPGAETNIILARTHNIFPAFGRFNETIENSQGVIVTIYKITIYI
jgi:hypothetical protein